MTLKLAILDRGTWTVSGVSDEGAWDASAGDPERVRRRDDTIARGFSVNENVDKPADSSSDMSEPGLVPHAYKVAAALRAEARELEKTALSPEKIQQMVLNGAKSRLARGTAPADLRAQLGAMGERLMDARFRTHDARDYRTRAFQRARWGAPDEATRDALLKEHMVFARQNDSLRDQILAARLALRDAPDELAPLRGKLAAAGVPGLKATVPSLKAPQAPRLPKPAAPKALDPRTDKPAGMNLMHGVTTVSNGSDVGASYTSFSRRLQGSPV
jgi:hypothetical protein